MWKTPGPQIASSGEYATPGSVDFTLDRQGVIMVSADIYKIADASVNDIAGWITVNGATCGHDRGVKASGAPARGAAACVLQLPPGVHNVSAGATASGYSTFRWSFVVLRM